MFNYRVGVTVGLGVWNSGILVMFKLADYRKLRRNQLFSHLFLTFKLIRFGSAEGSLIDNQVWDLFNRIRPQGATVWQKLFLLAHL